MGLIMARKNHDQNAVRQYLLRQLSDAEQQTFELRLLSDGNLFEELEIAEDELVDEYIAKELAPVERKQFEQYFLSTPERKHKLRFAATLDRYVSKKKVPDDVTRRFAFLEEIGRASCRERVYSSV